MSLADARGHLAAAAQDIEAYVALMIAANEELANRMAELRDANVKALQAQAHLAAAAGTGYTFSALDARVRQMQLMIEDTTEGLSLIRDKLIEAVAYGGSFGDEVADEMRRQI